MSAQAHVIEMAGEPREVDQEKELTDRALTWPEKARAIRIRSQPTYEEAATALQAIKALREKVNETFDPIIADAHKAHKTALGKKKDAEQPLAEAEGILKSGMKGYFAEQERIRREQELKAQREAEGARRAEVEAERKRAEKQARADGLKAAEARRQAELIAAPKERELAAAPPVVVAPRLEQVKGISQRDNWKAEVTDLMALVKAIAEGKASLEFVTANMTPLNGMARALKGTMDVPGVRAWNDVVISAGAR